MTYGCHNRNEYTAAVVVQDGWMMENSLLSPRMVFSPFRMERDCQYTKTALGQADPKCQGCKHRLDI